MKRMPLAAARPPAFAAAVTIVSLALGAASPASLAADPAPAAPAAPAEPATPAAPLATDSPGDAANAADDAAARPERARAWQRASDPEALLDGGRLRRLGAEVEAAARAFAEAALEAPALVSLATGPRTPAAGGRPEEAGAASPDQAELRALLRILSHKTHSNRAWRQHWLRHAEAADALHAALANAPVAAAGLDGEAAAAWARHLAAWAALARAKVASQDRYLLAIEGERDAVEERLEAQLDAAEAARNAEEAAPVLIGAFERRARKIDELTRRLEAQRAKRLQAIQERVLLQRQVASLQALGVALSADVALARREAATAMTATLDDLPGAAAPWRQVWLRLRDDGRDKVARIVAEAEAVEQRARSAEVDVSLIAAQISYRAGRIASLERELDEASGVDEWLVAARRALVDWLAREAWKTGLALLAIALAVRVAFRLTDRALAAWRRRAERDPDNPLDDDGRALTLVAVTAGISRPAILIVAAMLAVEAIGLSANPLLGSAAIVGLAISFGSQNLVRDIVNGFFILVEHQYAVGETIDIGGKVGTVERVTIRSTWLRQNNGDLHIVPNGAITVVSNLTRTWSRAIVDVGVAYGTDIDRTRTIAEAAGAELYADPAWRPLLSEAPSWVGVVALADSAVVHRVWVQVRAGEQWAVQRELYRRLKIAFDREGIEIPFPQRVVWHRGDDAGPPRPTSPV